VAFEPRTAIGEATIRIFAINDADRVVERQILHGSGRYP
ncbi:MAG: HNH endonuclease, partial [Armatimonadetes bacterium]|nr:HNH endonuclease [Armatimonadota bacterium]